MDSPENGSVKAAEGSPLLSPSDDLRDARVHTE